MKTSKILLVMGSIAFLLLTAGLVVSFSRPAEEAEITPLPTYDTYKNNSFLDKLFNSDKLYESAEVTASESPYSSVMASASPSSSASPFQVSPSPTATVVPSSSPVTSVPSATPSVIPSVSAKAPEIGIRNESYPPKELTVNNTADLVGIVYCSEGVLTSVRASIESFGEEIQMCEYTPNLPTLSLAGTVNASIHFATLTAGPYTYILTASANNEGAETTCELIRYEFEVKSAAATSSGANANTQSTSASGSKPAASASPTTDTSSQTSEPSPTVAVSSYSAKRTDDSSNGGIIWNYLIDIFQNPYAVAGIMSNIYHESSYNPNAGNSDFSSINSYGLCQWTGDRKDKLLHYATDNSLSVYEISTQLDFMMYELSSGYSSLLSDLYASDSAYDSAIAFCRKYEGAASTENRGNTANTILDKYAKD